MPRNATSFLLNIAKPLSFTKSARLSPKNAYAYIHHSVIADTYLSAQRSLNATLDEVRLFHSEAFADNTLKIIDAEDLGFFRRALLKRELANDMDFDRQRDHAAHTVSNYLLGWSIFANLSGFREHLRDHFVQRFACPGADYSNPLFYMHFGGLWPYVSLLHDVGYLFEGGISASSNEHASQKAQKGAESVAEYFDRRSWQAIGLSSVDFRQRTQRMTGADTPQIASSSLGNICESLSSLGAVEALRAAVCRERSNLKLDTPEFMTTSGGLSSDTFELWQQYYLAQGQPEMAERCASLRLVSYKLLEDGLPGPGVRVLDHGITGGLLLLLQATFYYQLHFGLPDGLPSDVHDAKVWRLFKTRDDGQEWEYHADWWWSGLVWASAATGIHNVVQQFRSWPGCDNRDRRLKVEEDPLAYLGVLVDVLQEWDRYTTGRSSVFDGRLPICGADVRLEYEAGKLHVTYPSKKLGDKVVQALEQCLIGWESFIVVWYDEDAPT